MRKHTFYLLQQLNLVLHLTQSFVLWVFLFILPTVALFATDCNLLSDFYLNFTPDFIVVWLIACKDGVFFIKMSLIKKVISGGEVVWGAEVYGWPPMLSVAIQDSDSIK